MIIILDHEYYDPARGYNLETVTPPWSSTCEILNNTKTQNKEELGALRSVLGTGTSKQCMKLAKSITL